MDGKVVACPACGKRNRVPPAAKGTPRCGTCKATLPWIADATDRTYPEVVEQSTIPVLVDLWAGWCQPCFMVSPALERLARDFAGLVKLVKVDVEKNPALSEHFNAKAVPTLVLLRNGQEVARQTGAAPERALRTWLEEGLSTRR